MFVYTINIILFEYNGVRRCKNRMHNNVGTPPENKFSFRRTGEFNQGIHKTAK